MHVLHSGSKVVGMHSGRLPRAPRRGRHCPTQRYQTFQRQAPARQTAWQLPQWQQQQTGVQPVPHSPQKQHQTEARACPVPPVVRTRRKLSHTLRRPAPLQTGTLLGAVRAQTQQQRQRRPQRHQLVVGNLATVPMPPTPQRRRLCPRCRSRWSCRCQSPRWPQQLLRPAQQR